MSRSIVCAHDRYEKALRDPDAEEQAIGCRQRRWRWQVAPDPAFFLQSMLSLVQIDFGTAVKGVVMRRRCAGLPMDCMNRGNEGHGCQSGNATGLGVTRGE